MSDRYIADEASVIVSWNDVEDVFLQPASQATLLLSLDEAEKIASFRIRIPFHVDRFHAALFAFVDPHHIRQIRAGSHLTAVPEPVRQSLVGKGAAHGIVSLEIQLSQSPSVVGPATTTRLRPGGKAGGNLLAGLRSMCRAQVLTIFAAENDLRMDQLSVLCEAVSAAALRANPREHALEALYNSRGAKDISDLLSPFSLRLSDRAGVSADRVGDVPGPAMTADEEPPAYDEVQPAPASTGKSRSIPASMLFNCSIK